VTIREFQQSIAATYLEKDARRGLFESFGWLVEETGELAHALRHGRPDEMRHEFSDCLAWLASLANMAGIDLEEAVARYASGCPRCGAQPCRCTDNSH
jgi:NTP pyrophosphatase (non-canonical NTP hydrolase)